MTVEADEKVTTVAEYVLQSPTVTDGGWDAKEYEKALEGTLSVSPFGDQQVGVDDLGTPTYYYRYLESADAITHLARLQREGGAEELINEGLLVLALADVPLVQDADQDEQVA